MFRRATALLLSALFFSGPAVLAQGGFEFPGAQVQAGGLLSGAAAGDLDGDGAVDLVASTASGLAVLRGLGGGAFAPGVLGPAGSAPAAVALADADGDGALDAAVPSFVGFGGEVLLLAGDGLGGFGAPAPIASGGSPGAVVFADVDGDGNADLIVGHVTMSHAPTPTIQVFLGNGAGEFALSARFPVDPAFGTGLRNLVVADWNRDGLPDLGASRNSASHDNVGIWLGDGAGGFAGAPDLTVGPYPNWVATADFDLDGSPDLAAACSSPVLHVAYGDGAGGFARRARVAVGAVGAWIAAGDFDGDGDPDLATPLGSAVAVLPSDHGRAFGDALRFAAGQAPGFLLAADLDGDGRADLAVANESQQRLTILRGAPGLLEAPPLVLPKLQGRDVAAADLEGNGVPDLLVAAWPAGAVEALLGDGSLGFAPASSSPVGDEPGALRAGDFDEDGIADFACVALGAWGVVVSRGRGTGSFGPPRLLPVTEVARPLAVADLTGDGHADLVAGRAGASPGLSVFLGNGLGSFGGPIEAGLPSPPAAFDAGDLDGDGLVDLLLARAGAVSAEILRGDGAGGFVPGPVWALPAVATAVAATDLDGDGLLDLLAGLANGRIAARLATGGGRFGEAIEVAAELESSPIAALVARDLDGDGRREVAAACALSASVAVCAGGSEPVLAEGRRFGATAQPLGLVVDDFDLDGVPDVAVAAAGILLLPNLAPPGRRGD